MGKTASFACPKAEVESATRSLDSRPKFLPAKADIVVSLTKIGGPVRPWVAIAGRPRPPFDPQKVVAVLRLEGRRTTALYRTAAWQMEAAAVHLDTMRLPTFYPLFAIEVLAP